MNHVRGVDVTVVHIHKSIVLEVTQLNLQASWLITEIFMKV